MLLHAPAKLNLCLYLGPRRDDGLHELCSLFEPLALADLIAVTEAERDEVICPGVEGENLAARALAGAARARLGARRRCGSRSRSGCRSRPASAAAAATPPRSCASPPARSTTCRRWRPSSAPTCPRSCDPSLALVRGAGERVEPLPEPAPHAAVLLPDGGGLSTAEVFAEADRLGLGREREELEALAARLREAAGAGASPLAYPELLVNDLEPRRRARCARRSATRSTSCAKPAPRVALLSGSGPTAVGLFADLAAARAAAAAIDRDDAIVCAGGEGAMRMPGEEREGATANGC